MAEQNGSGGESKFGLTVRRAANLPAELWSDERIAAIKRTVAPDDASASEVSMFLSVAHAYQLDPFLKEIWLAKDKGRLIVLTGRDSFLKVARRDPAYRGYRSGVVHMKDEFAVEHTDAGVKVEHRIKGFDRGEIVGAYCVVYKEGHPPVLVMRRMDDFKHLSGKDNWKNYPSDMVETRVITAGHRRAFHISGLYAPEEFVDGELDPEVTDQERGSHAAAVGTRNRINELKARLSQEPAAVQEADYEILDEKKQGGTALSDPSFREEFGTELPFDGEVEGEQQRGKGVAEVAPPPERAGHWEPGAPKSDQDTARAAFWARYHELGFDTEDVAQEDARKDWLERHFGKRSIAQLSAVQLREAGKLLEEGDVPRVSEAAAGGMPA